VKKVKVQLSNDDRLIIWDVEDSYLLYKQGFYGKPLGVSKPKNNFREPLILDPVEGVYLTQIGLIEVTKNGEQIESTELKKIFQNKYNLLNEKYQVYHDLRNKGFIITPGIKYGCDFAVYEKGPGIDHAPYIIQLIKVNSKITASDIVKAGRLATTVKKAFVIAIVDKNIKYIEFNWWKA
jgi:tRNA-intron endonuclease